MNNEFCECCHQKLAVCPNCQQTIENPSYSVYAEMMDGAIANRLFDTSEAARKRAKHIIKNGLNYTHKTIEGYCYTSYYGPHMVKEVRVIPKLKDRRYGCGLLCEVCGRFIEKSND